MGIMRKLDRFRWPKSERLERWINASITCAFMLTALVWLVATLVRLQ